MTKLAALIIESTSLLYSSENPNSRKQDFFFQAKTEWKARRKSAAEETKETDLGNN